MKIIVAVNKNGYIGRDGKLMWRCSEDLKHFKKMTMDCALIVGSTTFENDLRGKMLPGRQMFVVGDSTKNHQYHNMNWCVGSAYTHQHIWNQKGNYCKGIWVIGGQSIYEQLMPLVTEIHMSIINDDQVGDKVFEVPTSFRGSVITYNFEPNAVT